MKRTIWKIFISLLLTGAMVCFENLPLINAEPQKSVSIDVVRDGSGVRKAELMLINGMGYLGARETARIFNAAVDFNRVSKKITLAWNGSESDSLGTSNEEKQVVFMVGSEYVVMAGIKRKMMKKPVLVDGHAYIPLEAVITRAFESLIGGQINWSFSRKTLWISYDGNIADIRHYTYDNYSRFVVELTEDADFTHSLSGADVILNIPGGKLALPDWEKTVSDGVISKIDLKESRAAVEFRIETGPNAGEIKVKKLPSPVRILVDIENKKVIAPSDTAKQTLKPAGPPKRTKVNIRDIKLIVIDPGHGGKDPGAIGPRGTKEKDITLKLAKKLSKKIRKELKIRTVMTRSNDTFVHLAKRTEIANSKDADIFISLHTNAALNPKSRGFEVYFLSGDASDKEAQAVANMENSVMAMENKSEDTDRLSKILWSLTMNQFMNESSELCSFISKHVVTKCALEDRGVKQAGFYVMRGARMPAVLVEVAFISNKKEERMLNKDDFQNKVVDAVCDAIASYKNWLTRR